MDTNCERLRHREGLCLKANRELGEVREDSNLVKSLAGEAQQSKGRVQRKYYQTQF